MRVRRSLLLAATALAIAACTSAPPDREAQVEKLTQQIRVMPGVLSAGKLFGDDAARGPAFFEVDVDVADDITGAQVAAITSAYLDSVHTGDYAGYRAELDIHRGDNLFLVDTGGRPVTNRDQIVSQAHSWVSLRQEFFGSTVRLRAAIKHDGGDPLMRAVPSGGSIELPETADYVAVAAAVGTLGAKFSDLSTGDWTISAGKQRPAEIRSSKRLPSPQEMDLWTTLNADQAIPHADVFTINGAVTGPFWVSEKIPADNLDTAVRLAQAHLPVVARMPVPVLYSATNQYQGHIGYHGEATGPVTILIGGCVKRAYRPTPAEQTLIDRYETCRR